MCTQTPLLTAEAEWEALYMIVENNSTKFTHGKINGYQGSNRSIYIYAKSYSILNIQPNSSQGPTDLQTH